ncbi:MAG: type VI secretion system tip protein TssI/VgrG [Polyangiales bacterium]|nr:type VI secretion system tip protein VgrG [Sandaracinaceae bacterium]
MSAHDQDDPADQARDAATSGAVQVATAAAQDPSSAGAAAQAAGTQAAAQGAQAGLAEAGVPTEVAQGATSVAAGAVSGGAAGAAQAGAGAAGSAAGSALSDAGVPPAVAGAVTSATTQVAGAAMARADASVQGGGGGGSSGASSGSFPGDIARLAEQLSAAVLSNVDDTAQAVFHFECPGSDVTWVVASVDAQQAMNEPYRVDIDLRTDDMTVEGGQLLGQSCALLIERGTVQHRLSGVVGSVRTGSTARDQVSVHVRVVPALWGLSQQRDTRIFQDLPVPKILATVLEAALQPYQRKVVLELERAYAVCEYRVQYDETTLDFVTRLMEEEGIAYWFDQEDDHEVMVLSDSPAKYRELVSLHDRELDFVSRDNAVEGKENVREFHMLAQMTPNAVVTRHFDWTHPSHPVSATAEASAPAEGDPVHGAVVGPRRELYEHDTRPLTFSEYSDGNGFGAHDSEPQTGLRYEAHLVRAHVASGVSTAIGMMPGVAFELLGHPMPELDGRYVVLTVKHHGLDRDGGAQREAYYNEFTCMLAEQMARPVRRTPKPRVLGMQTATVVGPADVEIHTDPHGRIRAQFHWDRLGERNEHSSCYMRVMQPWAGAGWGFMFLPRIGMEVTVTFLNGDPDQPLVTGTVYNTENAPPYPPHEELTKSTIKTRSSPTPADEEEFGYNELTFEDKKGAEEIILHAQMDLNETVENNHTTTVHGSHTNTVDGGDSESVGGDQSLSVSGNRTKTVSKDETITVTGKRTQEVTGAEEVKLHNTYSLTVDQTSSTTVTGAVSEKYQAGRTTTVTGKDVETVSDGKSVSVTGGALSMDASVSASITHAGAHTLALQDRVDLSTSTDFTVTNGSSSISSSGGTLTLSATTIELTVGGASIVIGADGISIAGPKVAATGQGSTLELTPSGAALSGPKITSSAMGTHEITGGLVKIN